MVNAEATVLESKITRRHGRATTVLFAAVVVAGATYAGWHLVHDLSKVRSTPSFEYVLLAISLSVALGFEFVNGFHDTANAVATVIYTHTLEPHLAVIWSGFWNFVGVLTSTGTVAFGIVSLLPVDLILKAGSHAGFAMIFALLFAAIIWNIGTWYFGLPNSSSHTMIGSIIGVGVANQILASNSLGTSGVDWTQAVEVAKSLSFSPVAGFVCSALLFLLLKRIVPDKRLYEEPDGAPPPLWIRGILMLTCTGVSFAHGSNDGQKGMGLIMLILVGTVPAAYALNTAVSPAEAQDFLAASARASAVLERRIPPGATLPRDVRLTLERLVSKGELEPGSVAALDMMEKRISAEVGHYGSYSQVPTQLSGNIRNDMYVTAEALRVIREKRLVAFDESEATALQDYRRELDRATKFIPTWVKIAVALALGLGTMVGWKRIVVTVGERIGRQHLTYAQGACSEAVAMATILAADRFGLPVSTTHVLTSGVAGTMAANHAGLQWPTLRALAAAWLLTLPASIALAGSLFWVFRKLIGS